MCIHVYVYVCVCIFFYMTAFPTRQKIELFLQKKGTQKETEEGWREVGGTEGRNCLSIFINIEKCPK